MKTRGFVTIATGSEKYYKLAQQLLMSYRKYAVDRLPFALICDRENAYTQDFDDVVVVSDVHKSYLDKLQLHRWSPYDETIFVDADSLFLSDPAGLWEDFETEGDVSCYGWRFPLHSNRGWYYVDGCGVYKDGIEYEISLHGGVYFLRKGEVCNAVFNKALELAKDYHKYAFADFSDPADEPVLALSMAIHKIYPCQKAPRVVFYPGVRNKLKVRASGKLYLDEKICKSEIMHFATPNTERFLYAYLNHLINTQNNSLASKVFNYTKIRIMTAPKEIRAMLRHGMGACLRKVLPHSYVEKLKKNLLGK